MTIEMPLRAGSEPVVCQRAPYDTTDQHVPIFDAKCGCVAHVFDKATAEKVVLAFNAHQQLVDALRDTWEAIDDWACERTPTVEEIASLREQTRAALAIAEDKP